MITKTAKCTVTGHSGCENTAPNSVESIKKAFEAGADITEIDIRFAKDGTPVLSHDAANDNALTLDEAFVAAKPLGNMQINLDIKETSHLRNIIPIAEKYSITERLFCTGIFEKDAEEMKKQLPGYNYYLNIKLRSRFFQSASYYNKICRTIKENGAIGLNSNYKNLTAKLVEHLHKNDLLVSAWTVDNEDDMQKIFALGVDNITTRHPAKLAKIIKK